MPTEDIRIKVSARTNRKVRRLVARFGMAGWAHLTFLWMEASQERAKGRLFGWTEEDVELAADWRGTPGEFCQALLNIGFLDRAEDGVLELHDWPDHQPHVYLFEEASNRAREKALKRWGKLGEHPRVEKPNSAESRSTVSKQHAAGMQAAMLLPTTHPPNQQLATPSSSPADEPTASPRSPRKPSEHHAFIAWWSDRYEQIFSAKYAFQAGKDGRLVSTMLKQLGLQELRRRAEALLTSKDPWFAEKGRDIGTLSANLNKLASAQPVENPTRLKPPVNLNTRVKPGQEP